MEKHSEREHAGRASWVIVSCKDSSVPAANRTSYQWHFYQKPHMQLAFTQATKWPHLAESKWILSSLHTQMELKSLLRRHILVWLIYHTLGQGGQVKALQRERETRGWHAPNASCMLGGSCIKLKREEGNAGMQGGEGRKQGGWRASPWSAGGKVFLQCFSESERFLCPDRSAWKRDRERVLVN